MGSRSAASETESRAASAKSDVGIALEAGLVAAGGALGTLARAAIASASEGSAAHFPTTTQTVNLVGAALLGALLAWLEAEGPRPRLRAFLAVGLLGSFTTFSTLALEGVKAARATSVPAAFAGVGVAIALGLVAFFAAERATAHWLGSTHREGDRNGGTGP